MLVLVLGFVATLASVERGVAREDAEPDLSAVTLTGNDCSFLIQLDDDPRPRLGDIACGTLDVPENWAERDGRRIQIGYAILKSTSPTPAPDPVVYLEGGPGGSALTGIEARADFFAGMRQQRDVVLFDQRGTRLSTPLRCEGLRVDLAFQEDEGQDAIASPDGTPVPAPTPLLPSELGEPFEIMQAARQTEAAAAADCAREITAAGVDLRQYNSIASANDTVALMEALGYEEFNLYGISYGTRLALVIMRDHPESGIRSVVLDSTFPPEIEGFERYPEEPHEVVIQLFADCSLDPECHAAYPDLKERFVALLPRLRADPVVTEDGIPVTDRDLIEVMQGLAGYVQAAPYVPLMIDELERGEATVFVGIASGSLFEDASGGGVASDADVEQAVPTHESDAALTPEDTADASPARQFLIDLQERTAALPEDEAAELFGMLLHLDKLPMDRVTIAEFIGRAFPGPDHMEARDALFDSLAGLNAQDVRELYTILEQTVTLFDFLTFGASPTQFNSVECNEEIPFQSFERTVAIAQELEIPELAMGVVEGIAAQFAVCEVWPSGRAPAIEQLPVTSDVPTLILSGSYDLQTPVSWNKSAFVTLPNGYFVEFPMSGHGVILYSECAQEVAQEFIQRPIDPPGTSCVAELKPDWVMPPVAEERAAPATPVARAASAVTAG